MSFSRYNDGDTTGKKKKTRKKLINRKAKQGIGDQAPAAKIGFKKWRNGRLLLLFDENSFDETVFDDTEEIVPSSDAVLAFSEATSLPLTLRFETAGRPIVFTIDSESTFEGNFVLATLADQQTQSQAHTQAKVSTQKRAQPRSVKPQPHISRSNVPGSRPTNNGDNLASSRNNSNANLERSQRLESAYDELMDDDNDFDEMLIQNDTAIVRNQPDRTKSSETNAKQTTSDSLRTISAKGDNLVQSVRSYSPVPGTSKDSEESPVIPVLGTKVKIADTSLNEDVDLPTEQANQNEEDEECIPGTPPAKRFRSLFFGSSQMSTQSQKAPSNVSKSHVLATDTDDED